MQDLCFFQYWKNISLNKRFRAFFICNSISSVNCLTEAKSHIDRHSKVHYRSISILELNLCVYVCVNKYCSVIIYFKSGYKKKKYPHGLLRLFKPYNRTATIPRITDNFVSARKRNVLINLTRGRGLSARRSFYIGIENASKTTLNGSRSSFQSDLRRRQW